MTQKADEAIVLARVNFGERDRILTILTRQYGKISVLAKSVRSQKSRLAGGTELLSTSNVTWVEGKSDLKTLTGARLITHFGNITADMHRTRQAFDMLKLIAKLSEDESGQEYYELVESVLAALNEISHDPRLVEVWFGLRIMQLNGTAPRINGQEGECFQFDHQSQTFIALDTGSFTVNDLKLFKLSAGSSKPIKLNKPTGSEDRLVALIKLLLKTNLTEV